MFVISLAISLAILAIVGLQVWARDRNITALVPTAIFAFVPLACALFLPCVILQAVLLAGTHLAWKRWQFGRGTYLALLVGFTALAYVGYSVWYQLHLSNLRPRYPYQSIEARLPSRSFPVVRSLPGAIERELEEQEYGIRAATVMPYWSNDFREYQLRVLHEDAATAFIGSFGFGAGRMPGRPLTAWSLDHGIQDAGPMPQPAPGAKEWLSAEVASLAPAAVDEPAGELHRANVLSFVYAEGFGYLKDRRNVSGFRPHHFRKPPEDYGQWKLQTLELVGLVVHEKPVVYVSNSLPRMDALDKASRRPPDAFEEAGLAALRRSHDLHIQANATTLRMLGSLRAAKQCTGCHGCERGELLGAFSYTFKKE